MKPTPIHQLIDRAKPLPLGHRIRHMQALLRNEKPRSARRGDLEAYLRELIVKQIKFENRSERKTA